MAPPVWDEGGPAVPAPPGTRVPRQRPYWDQEPSPWPARLVTAGVAVVSLAAGILIGRFLLP